MHAISFIFRPGTYDAEFHRLDDAIAAVARRTDGFLGSETWVSRDGGTQNSIYYWSDLRHLHEFAQALEHREAKASYARWYDAYQVVISEIRAAYGDGRLDHITNAIATVSPVGAAGRDASTGNDAKGDNWA